MTQFLFGRRPAQIGLCGFLAVLFAGVATMPAAAAVTVISTGACNTAALTQPFLPWGDTNSYEPVPGGDFEGSLTGWTLSGGAHTVSGSEPYAVTGSLGNASLALPAGASAQTPPLCVNAAYPTFRFFAHNDTLPSTLLVTVVYRTPAGLTIAVPVGVVGTSSDWEPTLPMLTGSVAEGALSGGTAEIALRFTAIAGTSEIDDVYVDPRMK
jgi:hypothetical protein